MKYRYGYVSNSSSSSFVISKEVYPGIWDVVIAMLSVRDDDRERAFGKTQAALYNDEAIKRAIVNDNEDRQEENVVFPTCNFDTYVHDAGDSWWIATCNNHSFLQLFSDDGAFTRTKNFQNNVDYYNVEDYIEMNMEKDFDFYEV